MYKMSQSFPAFSTGYIIHNFYMSHWRKTLDLPSFMHTLRALPKHFSLYYLKKGNWGQLQNAVERYSVSCPNPDKGTVLQLRIKTGHSKTSPLEHHQLLLQFPASSKEFSPSYVITTLLRSSELFQQRLIIEQGFLLQRQITAAGITSHQTTCMTIVLALILKYII